MIMIGEKDMSRYFVLDMGGTFVKYALMDENARILEQGKFPAQVEDLGKLLDDIESKARAFEGGFDGVAVSMPGRIDTAKGIAYTGGSYRFFENTPFEKMLEDRLHVPVTLANDGKCAAMAEVKDGALQDVNSGAVVVIGTGIGGGIVLDRKVWMGSSGGAGEFSWTLADFPVFAREDLAISDLFGAVWTGMSSATALVMMYATRKGEDPSAHSGLTFFEAYDSGDPDAIEVLKQFGQNTAAGIYSIQSVLDLERYAIGGGISARKEVTDVIRDCLNERFAMIPIVPFSKPEIVTCRYGNDANLIGALRFHLNR